MSEINDFSKLEQKSPANKVILKPIEGRSSQSNTPVMGLSKLKKKI